MLSKLLVKKARKVKFKILEQSCNSSLVMCHFFLRSSPFTKVPVLMEY